MIAAPPAMSTPKWRAKDGLRLDGIVDGLGFHLADAKSASC